MADETIPVPAIETLRSLLTAGLKYDREMTEALADLQSHSAVWRASLAASMRRSRAAPPDLDDKISWWHEIGVFDRVVASLARLAPRTEKGTEP